MGEGAGVGEEVQRYKMTSHRRKFSVGASRMSVSGQEQMLSESPAPDLDFEELKECEA